MRIAPLVLVLLLLYAASTKWFYYLDAHRYWEQLEIRRFHEDVRKARKINNFLKSLPGIHAITGCDYNPAFLVKGKFRSSKILKRSEVYQKPFVKFGKHELFENNNEQQSTFDIIEQFICVVYIVGSITNIDTARL